MGSKFPGDRIQEDSKQYAVSLLIILIIDNFNGFSLYSISRLKRKDGLIMCFFYATYTTTKGKMFITVINVSAGMFCGLDLTQLPHNLT